jgi:hypothetical protein
LNVDRFAASLQVAGMVCGIAAGFVVDTALGLLSACVALLVVGVALERR